METSKTYLRAGWRGGTCLKAPAAPTPAPRGTPKGPERLLRGHGRLGQQRLVLNFNHSNRRGSGASPPRRTCSRLGNRAPHIHIPGIHSPPRRRYSELLPKVTEALLVSTAKCSSPANYECASPGSPEIPRAPPPAAAAPLSGLGPLLSTPKFGVPLSLVLKRRGSLTSLRGSPS